MKSFFFDRKKDIDEIIRLLEKGRDVAIVGESGVGKSSILCQLRNKVRNGEILKGRTVLYIDMQRIESKEEFALKALHQLNVSVERGNSWDRLKEKFEESIKGKNVVLIIDEFDKVTELSEVFDHNFVGWLRSWGQSKKLALLIAERKPPLYIFQDSGKTSPFYNVFVVKRIEPFNEKQVINYVSPWGIGEETGKRIFKLTKGHPRTVNLAVFAWCNHQQDENIKQKYRTWEKYYKHLIKIYRPPEPRTLKGIMSSGWILADRISLAAIGFIGTAVIVNTGLFSLIEKTGFPVIVHWVLLVFISAAAGVLLYSLGLEGVAKLIGLMK